MKLIIRISFAALMLMPLLASAAWSAAPATAGAPEQFKTCQQDSDCMRVAASCNGCCAQDAINKDQEQAYAQFHETSCAGYHGAVCECMPLNKEPWCDKGRCELR